MAASTTAMPSGWCAANSAISASSRRKTGGWTSAFSRASRSGSPKTRAARARRSISPASRQNLAAEFPHHVVVSFAARREHLVPEFVGLHEQTAIACQRLTDEALPAGEPAGQADLQHTA